MEKQDLPREPRRYEAYFALLILMLTQSSGQIPSRVRMIGEDDPCAVELGVSSPSDNLSCEFVASGGTRCYTRDELCNGDLGIINVNTTPFNRSCPTGSDEGANIAALDCKSAYKVRQHLALLHNTSR